VSHANAALTPRHRLRLARLVVEQDRSVVYAARLFNVSWPTAKRWIAVFSVAKKLSAMAMSPPIRQSHRVGDASLARNAGIWAAAYWVPWSWKTLGLAPGGGYGRNAQEARGFRAGAVGVVVAA